MIRKIDIVIWKDVVPPWLFSVGLFAALLMAATYLGRVAGFIVDGVPPLLVLELFGLLMMPILTKTFTMSVLLASLLGIGRLSSDSEIVALRASGASVYRIILPVALFSLVLAIFTFAFNETFVPIADNRYKEITATMVKSLKTKDLQPVAQTFIKDKRLQAAIIAENLRPADQEFDGVTMIAYNDKGDRTFTVYADHLKFEGSSGISLLDQTKALTNWRLSGHVTVVSADLRTVINADDGWPSQMPGINQNFVQLTAPKDMDPDQFTMRGLREFLIQHRKQQDIPDAKLNDYEYGYWGKVAIPLGAIMFGVLGAVLGIRSHRTGVASGYGMAIGLTFAFVFLANLMNVFAQGGAIPAWSAAFTPLVIGSIASGVIMWRRNQ